MKIDRSKNVNLEKYSEKAPTRCKYLTGVLRPRLQSSTVHLSKRTQVMQYLPVGICGVHPFVFVGEG